jgi:glycosyltransferase involved in cell wall biosynthesis
MAADTHVCMIAYSNFAIDARVRREALTLAEHGFQVRCLTNQNGATPQRFAMGDVQVQELPVPKYRGKSTMAYMWSYVRFLAASSRTCLGLLAKGQLDVVHVHNLPDFLVFAALLPRLAGCKVVLDVHDSFPETYATKFSGHPLVWKALCLEERLSALVAHRVICVNEPQRDALLARGIPRSKTFVSMNVPDPRIFRRDDLNLAAEPSDHFELVYHGTMAERLGVDLIIRAVANLSQRIPRVRLNLWGHGDDLPVFTQLAEGLGVKERIRFEPKGYPLPELPKHLRRMQIGVVGNRRSLAGDLMLPVKLMEYAALGIPAVVPRLKTIEHYCNDEMVSYFEPESAESMADAIYRLYVDPGLRRRQAAAAGRFLDEYGWERQGRAYVDFYQRLLGVRVRLLEEQVK